MDAKKIQMMKAELLAEKARIEEYLSEKARPDPLIKGNYTTPLVSSDPTDTMDEKAQEVTNFEEDRAIEQNMEIRLKHINQQLAQIEAGSYGKCLDCRSYIEEKRLHAMSSAQLCVSCAAKKATLA